MQGIGCQRGAGLGVAHHGLRARGEGAVVVGNHQGVVAQRVVVGEGRFGNLRDGTVLIDEIIKNSRSFLTLILFI